MYQYTFLILLKFKLKYNRKLGESILCEPNKKSNNLMWANTRL